MPSLLPLSIKGDTLDEAFQPISGVTFQEEDLHPDLWAQSKLVDLLPLVSGVSKASKRSVKKMLSAYLKDIQNAPEDQLDLKTQSPVATELHYAIVEDRDRTLQKYGPEIEDQSGSFHHYFYNVLSINPIQYPNTARLISVGMMVSGIVGMEWKLHFMRARPVQVWPGILPVLPTPPHPSFPSNHATQAETVSGLIQHAVGAVGEKKNTGIGAYLSELSLRIAHNRERAGLHYQSDSEAGRALADWVVGQLVDSKIVEDLLKGCKAELSQFDLS